MLLRGGCRRRVSHDENDERIVAGSRAVRTAEADRGSNRRHYSVGWAVYMS